MWVIEDEQRHFETEWPVCFQKSHAFEICIAFVYSAYVRQNSADEDKSNFRLVEYRDSDRHCGRTFFQQLPKWCTPCEAVLKCSAVVSWTAPAFSMMLHHITNSNAITLARQHFWLFVILPAKKVFPKTKKFFLEPQEFHSRILCEYKPSKFGLETKTLKIEVWEHKFSVFLIN